jgi:hypothetical protein
LEADVGFGVVAVSVPGRGHGVDGFFCGGQGGERKREGCCGETHIVIVRLFCFDGDGVSGKEKLGRSMVLDWEVRVFD